MDQEQEETQPKHTPVEVPHFDRQLSASAEQWIAMGEDIEKTQQGQMTECQYIESTFKRLDRITNFAHETMERLYNKHKKTSKEMNEIVDQMHDMRFQIYELMKDKAPKFQRDKVDKINIENKTYFEIKPPKEEPIVVKKKEEVKPIEEKKEATPPVTQQKEEEKVKQTSDEPSVVSGILFSKEEEKPSVKTPVVRRKPKEDEFAIVEKPADIPKESPKPQTPVAPVMSKELAKVVAEEAMVRKEEIIVIESEPKDEEVELTEEPVSPEVTEQGECTVEAVEPEAKEEIDAVDAGEAVDAEQKEEEAPEAETTQSTDANDTPAESAPTIDTPEVEPAPEAEESKPAEEKKKKEVQKKKKALAGKFVKPGEDGGKSFAKKKKHEGKSAFVDEEGKQEVEVERVEGEVVVKSEENVEEAAEANHVVAAPDEIAAEE